MFKHILVPLDFTEKTIPTLEIAADMAAHDRARLTLLHVIEELEMLSTRESRGFYSKLESNAKSQMQEFAKRAAREGVELNQKLVYGNRAGMIVSSAQEMEVDLIVMRSHRIDPEIGQGWGTISYRVALLSPCPVLLVK